MNQQKRTGDSGNQVDRAILVCADGTAPEEEREELFTDLVKLRYGSPPLSIGERIGKAIQKELSEYRLGEQEVADASQEVLLITWVNLTRIRSLQKIRQKRSSESEEPRRAIWKWLETVIENIVGIYIRPAIRSKREVRYDEIVEQGLELFHGLIQKAPPTDAKIDVDLIMKKSSPKLSPMEKRVLRLRLKGFSHKETARALGKTERAVIQSYYRARKKCEGSQKGGDESH